MFFVKLFYAVLLIGSGVLILKYRRFVKSWTGNFTWAEYYLGRGSTYLIIILVALFMIFVGIFMPFGGLDFIFGTSGDFSNTSVKLK